MKKLCERDIEAYLVKRVKENGGEIRKVKWIGRRGAMDRLVLFPNSIIYFIELKAPNIKAEDYQIREHERFRAMGQTVLVIDSLEGVDKIITNNLERI